MVAEPALQIPAEDELLFIRCPHCGNTPHAWHETDNTALASLTQLELTQRIGDQTIASVERKKRIDTGLLRENLHRVNAPAFRQLQMLRIAAEAELNALIGELLRRARPTCPEALALQTPKRLYCLFCCRDNTPEVER